MVKKVKLKEIVDLQNGYAFKSDNYINFSNTMICRMSNIKPDIGFDINYNPKYIADDSSDLYKNYLLKDNDIIIAMTDLANDPKILGVPVLVKTNGKIILQNQRVGKLIIKSKEVDSSYLMRVLSTKKARNFYKRFSNGGLQINIGKKEILENIIPLPPLAEQKQIAKTLDKVTEIITLRKESITKLDALAKSIFIDMFGDPVSNLKKWEVKKLKELTSKIGSGSTPRGGKDSYKKEGISLIRSLNIHDNRFKYKDLALIDDLQAKSLSNVIVEKNDVLLNITGASVCRCAIVPTNVLPARVNQHVAIIRTIENLNPKFLLHLFISSYKLKLLNIASSGGATREALTKENLELLKIIVPPLDLQNKFAKIIEKIEEQKTLYTQELEKLQNNFDALLQKSFQE